LHFFTSELICCDGPGCNKAYHAKCVKVDINTLPLTWYCPSCDNGSSGQLNSKSAASESVQKNSNNNGDEKKDGNIEVIDLVASPTPTKAKKSASKSSNDKATASTSAANNNNTATTSTTANSNNAERDAPKLTSQQQTVKNFLMQSNPTTTAPSAQETTNGQEKSSNDKLPQKTQHQHQENTTNSSSTQNQQQQKPTRKRAKKVASLHTVTVPNGVVSGDKFHVSLGKGKLMGVICPQDVYSGDKLIVLEPGVKEPPIAAKTIANMNMQNFTNGIDSSLDSSLIANTFWTVLWPALQSQGWTYTRQLHYNFGSLSIFLPGKESVDKSKNELNVHYFNSITSVRSYIARLPQYTKVIQIFDAEIVKCKQAIEEADEKKKRRKRARVEPVLDAWKSLKSREHIKIGSQYQVRSLPRAGSHVRGEGNIHSLNYIKDSKQEQLWNTLSDSLPVLTPSLWYEWAKEPNFLNQFHQATIESKKQMKGIALYLSKPKEFCLWYYYSNYKPNKELYNPLKKMMNEVKEQENSDECAICEEGGELICCETCPQSYHLKCLGLTASDVEHVEKWSCPICVRRQRNQLSPQKSSPRKKERIDSDSLQESDKMDCEENPSPLLNMPFIEKPISPGFDV